MTTIELRIGDFSLSVYAERITAMDVSDVRCEVRHDWKSRMGPRARVFYAGFEQMIAACGEYHVAPAKTRIAFLGHVRFASITRSFALPKPLKSSRFHKIDEVVPHWWVHWMRIAHPRELDDQMQAWIRESYRLMGMRERLRRS